MVVHMRTYSPRARDLNPSWRVIDAEGKTLGRLATQIATILRGKDKPTFTRHMSVGDFVIVINASKIRVSGQKTNQKIYYHHTQYPGGLRKVTYRKMANRFPERVIRLAVRGMLPHNRLGRQILRRMKVYAGPEHPHEAQVRSGEGKRAEAVVTAAPDSTPSPTPAPARRRRTPASTRAAPNTPRTRRSRSPADGSSAIAKEAAPGATEAQDLEREEGETKANAAPRRRRSRAKAADQASASESASESVADSGSDAAAKPDSGPAPNAPAGANQGATESDEVGQPQEDEGTLKDQE